MEPSPVTAFPVKSDVPPLQIVWAAAIVFTDVKLFTVIFIAAVVAGQGTVFNVDIALLLYQVSCVNAMG